MATLFKAADAWAAWQYEVRDEETRAVIGTVCLVRAGRVWCRGIAIVGMRRCPEEEAREKEAKESAVRKGWEGAYAWLQCAKDCPACGGTGGAPETFNEKIAAMVSQGRVRKALVTQEEDDAILTDFRRQNVRKFAEVWFRYHGAHRDVAGCCFWKTDYKAILTVAETAALAREAVELKPKIGLTATCRLFQVSPMIDETIFEEAPC